MTSSVSRDRAVERLRRRAKATEAWSEIDDEGQRFEKVGRLHERLRLNGRNRKVERVGVELDQERVVLLRDRGLGPRRGIDDDPVGSPPSMRIVTRGTRQSPTISSRDDLRRSSRES